MAFPHPQFSPAASEPLGTYQNIYRMTEGNLAQHPPAKKVGGRRLSVSTKHRVPEAAINNATAENGDKEEIIVPDYPRPTPLTAVEEAAQQELHRNEQESPPKREKKHNHHNDKKIPEHTHWETETTRPTRDMNEGNKGQTMGIRIGQPAGKGFGV